MALATLYSLASVALVSLVSLLGVMILSMGERFRKGGISFLVSLSVGALFGDAFIHLLPELFEGNESPLSTSLFILLGVLIFFVLEKALHWHRHHNEEASEEEAHGHIHPIGTLVLISDGVHNMLDGAIIAASFLVGTEVGIATTVAVVLHEIPQEIGDFGIFLYAGFSRAKALLFNFLSALSAFIGAGAVLLLGTLSEGLTAGLVAIAAGSFIYIAGSDLVPELHKNAGARESLLQTLAVCVGIALMAGLLFLEWLFSVFLKTMQLPGRKLRKVAGRYWFTPAVLLVSPCKDEAYRWTKEGPPQPSLRVLGVGAAVGRCQVPETIPA